LDPKEKEYKSFYDNANDGNDFLIAQGFSYHNGPEWVWVYGFFLMAKLNLIKNDPAWTLERYVAYFTNHRAHINTNDWESLPELTNGNGQLCWFSSPAQAWSISAIIEAYVRGLKELKPRTL